MANPNPQNYIKGGIPKKGIHKQGKCIIPDCENAIFTLGMCNKHQHKYNPASKSRPHTRLIIAEEMSALTGLPIYKCEKLIGIILNVIREAMARGEEVKIPGFGIFGVHKFKGIWAGRPAYFWPSKELKEMVRKVKND